MKKLCLVICIFLSACTAGLGGAQITNLSDFNDRRPLQMEGILSQLDACKLDAASNCNLSIFYIHGMRKTPVFFHKKLLDYVLTLDGGEFRFETREDVPVFLTEDIRDLEVRGEAVRQNSICSNILNSDRCQFGTLFKDVYTGTVSGRNVSISSYALYWEKDAWEQVQMGYMMGDIETIEKDSVWINRALKKQVMDYGFSDAALYLSDFGKILRYSTETAICMMVRDSLTNLSFNTSANNSCDLAAYSDETSLQQIKSLNLTFVSKSLGSRVFMDSLLPLNELNTTYDYAKAVKLTSNDNPSDAEIIERTVLENQREVKATRTKKAVTQSLSKAYMLANQLPLLGLGVLEVEKPDVIKLRDGLYCNVVLDVATDDCLSPMMFMDQGLTHQVGFYQFVEDMSAAKDDNNKLRIYAFRDPNDILGFEATSHLNRESSFLEDNAFQNLDIIEIRHRNAKEWFWSFANPLSAHANEDDRKQSLALVWCGGDISPDGKLTAKSC